MTGVLEGKANQASAHLVHPHWLSTGQLKMDDKATCILFYDLEAKQVLCWRYYSCDC